MNLPHVVQTGWTANGLRDDAQAENCSTLARTAEDRGEYEKARASLAPFWSVIGERPLAEELTQPWQAEIFLRVGVVAGWLGSARAVEGAGEFATDMITEAMTLFVALGLVEKVAECQLEMAWCYWRSGAHNEARIFLGEALASLAGGSAFLRAKATLRLGIVERSAKKYHDAKELLESAGPLFDEAGSDILSAGMHNERAVVYKNLGKAGEGTDYFDRAFIEYAASLDYGERAGHSRHCGIVENNVGLLYLELCDASSAWEHLMRAREYFSTIRDARSVAQVDETRARVLLARGDAAGAERVVRQAVRTLDKAGERSLLSEALTTHALALARLGRGAEAHAGLVRAAGEASVVDDREGEGRAWLTVIEESDALQLSNAQLAEASARATRLLSRSQDGDVRCRLSERLSALLARSLDARERSADGVGYKEAVLRFKEQLIRDALAAAGWNVSAAARRLGMTEANLHQLLCGTFRHIKEGDSRVKKYARRPHLHAVPTPADADASGRVKPKEGTVHVRMPDDYLAGLGIRAGDWVVVEPSEVSDGEIVAVVVTSGDCAVGELLRADGRVTLKSRNFQLEDFDYRESDVVEYVGRVYGWYKADEEGSGLVRLL